MQYPRFASESDLPPNSNEDLSRVYPHPHHRHQSSLPNLHEPPPSPLTYAPYPYALVPKEEMRQYPPAPPPLGLEESEYRIGENYARGGDRSNPMVLSNPVPDYSVASGSSPFTLQPQAPHFQPRPRPVMVNYPLARHDFEQQLQSPQLPHLLPHQLPHSQQLHSLPHQQIEMPTDHRHVAYAPSWDYPGQPMRNGHEARLSEILSQPTQPSPLSYANVPHLPMHDAYQNMGQNPPIMQQQQPIQQQQQPRQSNSKLVAEPYPAEMYDQPFSEDEAPNESGKKPRKRRRLKGELPRDHALRKYKCTHCDQKFARPSSVSHLTVLHCSC